MTLLLLEDDPVLLDVVADFLQESYDVVTAMTTDEALEAMQSQTFDLYLFDINLPGQNGIDFLGALREAGDLTPAIITTAYQDIGHLQRGFDAGCSDYLKKPFDLEELLVRVRHLCDRDRPRIVEIGPDIRFEPQRHLVLNRGETRTLTQKESEILDYLITHAGRTVSGEELISQLWSYDQIPSDSTLRSYIKSLRKAVGKETIQTVHGTGYYFERH